MHVCRTTPDAISQCPRLLLTLQQRRICLADAKMQASCINLSTFCGPPSWPCRSLQTCLLATVTRVMSSPLPGGTVVRLLLLRLWLPWVAPPSWLLGALRPFYLGFGVILGYLFFFDSVSHTPDSYTAVPTVSLSTRWICARTKCVRVQT